MGTETVIVAFTDLVGSTDFLSRVGEARGPRTRSFVPDDRPLTVLELVRTYA
jgi:hypothetical protein